MPKKLIRTVRPTLRRLREPLAWISPAESATKNVKPAATIEKTVEVENEATYKAFMDGAKEERKNRAHDEEGYGTEYFVVVFKDGKQASAFLKGAGYPDYLDTFIDGTILAEILKIRIPETTVVPKKLKRASDARLISLSVDKKTRK